jgi:hypothetical protein
MRVKLINEHGCIIFDHYEQRRFDFEEDVFVGHGTVALRDSDSDRWDAGEW